MIGPLGSSEHTKRLPSRYNSDVIGVPHFTSDEDVYRGYYIPKGSIVFANS